MTRIVFYSLFRHKLFYLYILFRCGSSTPWNHWIVLYRFLRPSSIDYSTSFIKTHLLGQLCDSSVLRRAHRRTPSAESQRFQANKHTSQFRFRSDHRMFAIHCHPRYSGPVVSSLISLVEKKRQKDTTADLCGFSLISGLDLIWWLETNPAPPPPLSPHWLMEAGGGGGRLSTSLSKPRPVVVSASNQKQYRWTDNMGK